MISFRSAKRSKRFVFWGKTDADERAASRDRRDYFSSREPRGLARPRLVAETKIPLVDKSHPSLARSMELPFFHQDLPLEAEDKSDQRRRMKWIRTRNKMTEIFDFPAERRSMSYSSRFIFFLTSRDKFPRYFRWWK